VVLGGGAVSYEQGTPVRAVLKHSLHAADARGKKVGVGRVMLVTTKWISFSLSLSLSISFSFSLFLTFCPSVSLYISLSLYLSLFLSLSLSPGGVKQKEAGAFGEERKRSGSMHGNDQQLSADSHQFISENVLKLSSPQP